MKEFTSDEKIIAKNLSKEYEWIARDKCGSLFAFPDMPIKKTGIWDGDCFICISALFNRELFKQIKWEDDKPTLIKDIYDPQILDDVEREYIKAVLKPFHEKIEFVGKYGDEFSDDGTYHKEFLFITHGDGDRDKGDLTFPDFDAGKMYSGMELGKSYKLEELGIKYEEKTNG